MLIYILKSTAILAVLLLFYKLFLEKENIHVFKRHFLLASILLAIGIPSITFTKYVEAQPIFEPVMTEVIDGNFEIVSQEPPVDYTSIILWSIYRLGVLFFTIRFLINLTKIGLRIKNNPKLKKNGFVNVLIQDLAIPHTFFSYIFFNKYAFEAKKIPIEVTIHEQTHAKQLHSLDIMVLELLQVVFWFNPLLYVLKNYIKLNHEFLADEAVLKSGTELKKYQKTLLAYANTHNHYPIANAINYSSIKKRFTIMKTKSSQKKAWLKSLLLLPLVSVLIYGFSTQETVISKQLIDQETQESETQKDIREKLEKINNLKINYKDLINNTSDGASKEMIKEYNNFVKKYKNSKNKVINNTKLQRIIAIYHIMTESQKARAEKYPKTFNSFKINLNKIKGRTPNENEFNSWKNASKYAIWIDEKHSDNKRLENYKASDIVYFTGSFVHKNARSKKYPQPYQYSLFTANGFENTYKKANYNRYIALLKSYNKQLKKINQVGYSELQILKSRLDILFENFSSEELNKYKPKKASDLPLKTIQTKVTPEQLKEYNKWAKSLNNKDIHQRIVKIKNYNKYKKIYDSMSASQKKDAQPFPTLPPPPPPPPSRKFDIEKASENLRETYNQYKNKAETYAKNVRQYLKTRKGHDELYKQYNQVMELHKEVRKLSFKEGLLSPPPPPPMPAKSLKNKKTGWINFNNKKYYFIEKDKQRKYYNNYGERVRLVKATDGPMAGETIVMKCDHDITKIEIPKPPQQEQQKAKTGWVTYNNETYYYIEKAKETSYYNRFGRQVYPMTITSGPSAGDDFIMTVDDDKKRIKVPQPRKQQPNNGWVFINNTKYYYAIVDGKKQYYDRFGNKVSLNKEKTDSIVEVAKTKPKNKQNFIKSKGKDYDYYINGKLASYETAIALDKNLLGVIKIVKKQGKKPALYITTR